MPTTSGYSAVPTAEVISLASKKGDPELGPELVGGDASVVAVGTRRGASVATLIGVAAPMLGIVTSNALYSSPLPEALAKQEEGNLGEMNPLPTAFVVLSTISWVGYSLSIKNPYILASNLPGCVAAVAALVTLLPLTHGSDSLATVQHTLIGGTLCNLCLWSYLIFSGMSPEARSQALGRYATALCIVLFASPLSTIQTVLETRDSNSILATMTIAQCANCALWSVYGLWAAKDVYVYGPNLTGLALGLTQLALKLAFPSKAKS